MRVHHLNCGSLCPHGARLINGEGGLLERGHIVCHCLAIETGDGLVLVDTGFGIEDARNPRQLGAALRRADEPAAEGRDDGAEAARGARLRRRRRAPDRHHPPRPRPRRRAARLPRRPRSTSSPRSSRRRSHPRLTRQAALHRRRPLEARAALGDARRRRRRLVRLRERADPARPRRRGAAGAADRPLARPHRRRDPRRARAGCCTAATPTSTTARSQTPAQLPAGAALLPEPDAPPTTRPASPTRSACASWPPATATRSRCSAPTTRTSWSASRRRRASRPRPSERRGARKALGAAGRAGRAGADDRVHALAGGRARARASTATTTSGAGRSRTSRASGPRSGTSSRCRPTAATTASSAAARCPAPSGSPAPASTTPSTSSPARTTPRRRSCTPPSCASSSELSWGELRAQVAAVAAGLRELGVERGDRVVAYMPNIPEAIVAFLASASIGAVWSSCSPDFGPASVIDRFAQIEPKVLFAVDGYRYGGKDFDRRERHRRAAGGDAEPAAHRRPPLPRPRPRPLPPARRDPLGRAARRRRGRRAQLRARPLRPPALGPLLLRHDRPAEGDRPGPGRHPARAPEEAPPPRRRPPRRPPLLVHDDRLDDVELPRLRAC